MRGQELNDLPRCELERQSSHHKGIFFEVPLYIKAQKNDDRDAEGISEAATRPTMRFVELKTQQQLDMQTPHRSRDRLVAERTALINQLRTILLERGIVVPQGGRKLEHELVMLMDEQQGAGVGPRLLRLVDDMRTEWRELDRPIAVFDREECSSNAAGGTRSDRLTMCSKAKLFHKFKSDRTASSRSCAPANPTWTSASSSIRRLRSSSAIISPIEGLSSPVMA
jgi:Transposase